MTAQPEESVVSMTVTPPPVALTLMLASGADAWSTTFEAMNELVLWMPVFLAGAIDAVSTTGFVWPILGHVIVTVTSIVGNRTRLPPSHADTPVPVKFH